MVWVLMRLEGMEIFFDATHEVVPKCIHPEAGAGPQKVHGGRVGRWLTHAVRLARVRAAYLG